MHLKIKDMAVTVYTNELYRGDKVAIQENGDGEEVADKNGPADDRSDELNSVGEEFSGMGPVKVPEAEINAVAEQKEGGESEELENEESETKAPEHKTVDHLLSDFVIDFLENLEIPESHID